MNRQFEPPPKHFLNQSARFLILVVALVGYALPATAQVNINLHDLSAHIPSADFHGSSLELRDLAFYRSTGPALDIQQAVTLLAEGKFNQAHLKNPHNFGIGDHSLWFAIRMRNVAILNEPLYLYFAAMNPDAIDLWTIRSGILGAQISTHQSGHDIPPADRDVFINSSALRVDIDSGEETVLIWRVHNVGPTLVSMSLVNMGSLITIVQNDAMRLMTLVGGLFSLMLFSIFLFNAIRDKTYLLFIAQLFFFCGYLFTKPGFGNMYFWPNLQLFDKNVSDLSLLCALTVTLQLLRIFLNTRTNDRVFDYLLRYSSYALPVLVVVMFINYLTGVWILLCGIPVIVLLTQIVVVRAMFRREPGIVVAWISWAILSVGGALTIAVMFGWQVQDPAMTFFLRSDHWGIFIGSILFMFALTRRLQYLRRDKEQAELKNRLKQDFIANISHEMRTPLNGIIGFAESVAHSEHIGEIKFYNKRIISESERLLYQINQLLDLAKIEAGRFQLEKRPFSLPQSLAYLHSAYSMKASAKGLDFNLSMDSACPLNLNGDRLRLEQILRNLIDNAIKFTDSGSVGMSVKVYRQDKSEAVLVFDISDTGIGIEQNKLDLIMEDFVQADSSITRRFGGTGLGTSISRRLVEAMDGHIEVKSNQGMGTNFRVFLPFGISFEPEATPTPAPASPAETTIASAKLPGSQRILVVDDMETNRQVLGIHLRKLDVQIDEANDAEQAIAMLKNTAYDLVLMDVFMPGMSGHDATRVIRAMPGLEKLPIVAVTASGFQQDLDAAMAAGMDEILLKPVKRDSLLALVSRYLKT